MTESATYPDAPLDAATAAARAVAALIAGGVTDVVVAPGSRSAPLAYALADAEAAGRVRLHVRIDERSGCFTALGLALGAGRPAAVVTTSGTAVGELLPAVMEANHAAVPLVVVSADRPAELRGTGANQTTVQPQLFGVHVRTEFDVAAGDDPTGPVTAALRAARGGDAEDTPRGPVHLNLAFRDPLVPDGRAAPGPDTATDTATDTDSVSGTGIATVDVTASLAASAVRVTTGTTLADAAVSAAARQRPLPQARDDARTVVVAGHDAGEVAAAFAAHLELPLLAEPSSNARSGSSAVVAYRLLLEQLGPSITRVVVFGRPTLSRPVAALLARSDVEHALYLPGPAAWFEEGRRPERIIEDLSELLLFAGRGADGWLRTWQEAGGRAQAAIRAVLDGEEALTGLHVAEAVWVGTSGNLVLGSSNPIRDVDLMAATDRHPLRVFANRGLAGIDGTISTATGIALATRAPTRVLLGDLTFLHDVGGLLIGTGEVQPELQLVVLNDGGGGIFGLLEHGAESTADRYGAAVERLFGTPHAVDLAALAAAHGLAYEGATTYGELVAALERPILGRSVLEVRTQRSTLRDLHARIRRAVLDAATDVDAAAELGG
ncbi:2-succinyl-5-enolpyruvyl-6-hydroxy-3-cyclohexene-1-carboxylic-acid synthase [Arthrobacter echini]|uniref:2-succinyl-5-enolpyruvyl-6-hydroxy-3-cyclohexene-1-carboxylate synthase n=1 Tax=Arthrobacter echini TaxID=1529066 RepID=A0A5D0XTZ5_9MICC|nr:2-succinyl-5-enolpyruvyl-6-hydroxy-3-cyclohexene-1-carboxylic-acid synthase [Arthrobacter echini]TYD00129.1 2-succinyl-5-enolpyruvyl-6-hydroxy-3-cyclohexene-1-carboxylic-acid synthase [Arthrobacter echini]